MALRFSSLLHQRTYSRICSLRSIVCCTRSSFGHCISPSCRLKILNKKGPFHEGVACFLSESNTIYLCRENSYLNHGTQRWLHSSLSHLEATPPPSNTVVTGTPPPPLPPAPPGKDSQEKKSDEKVKPSSKLEAAVLQQVEEQSGRLGSVDKKSLPMEKSETTVAVPKTTIWQKIKGELIHTWHAFKLMWFDTKVAYGLTKRLLSGHQLSRREHQQLVRTVSDLFRLVPFSVFIIVPFLEFTLPFFLYFFPNMLPSQFAKREDIEERNKKVFLAKVEVAKFLQQTLDEMAAKGDGRQSRTAKELVEFIGRARSSEEGDLTEIIKFSKMFEDEITLDNLERSQLVALCKLLEMTTIGTNNMLRFQIRMRLRKLRADDKLIRHEGLSRMTAFELQQACRARGMRSFGVSRGRLISQLDQWLQLSLDHKVPPTLILLSRALLFLPDHVAPKDRLRLTLGQLPDSVVTRASAAAGEKEGKVHNKSQFDITKLEQEKIEMEREEERKKAVLDKEQLIDKAPEIKAKESETLHFGPKLQEKTGLLAQQLTVIVSKGTTAQPKKAEALIKQLRERPTSISKEDVDLIKHILEHSTTETSQAEKTLNEIKKEFADYIEDRKALEDLKKADPKTTIRESIGSKILSKKLNKMITQLEKTQAVIKMQAAIEEAEKVGGMKDHAIQQERETYESGALMIKGLIHELQKISANVTEEKAKVIESILEELDEDHDGFLSKEFLWKVTDLLKDSDLSISKEQIKEVVEILRKEQELRKDGTPSGEGK